MNEIEPSQLEQLIKTRRSIRKFKQQTISYDKLLKLIEAAIWAPNGCNQQELRFRIVVEPDEIEVVNKLKPNIKNPQVIILVYADSKRSFYVKHKNPAHAKRLPYLDAGAAIQNLLLRAHSMGIASCWLNLSPAYPNIESLYKKFPHDAEFEIVSAVALGYKDEAVNVKTAEHVGSRIRRHDLNFYLLSTGKKILVLHDPSLGKKEFPNLGSDAYRIGLYTLLNKYYPSSVIDSIEPIVDTLSLYYQNLVDQDSWRLFDAWVTKVKNRGLSFQKIEQQHKNYLDITFRVLNKIHKRTIHRNDILSRFFEKYFVREGLFYYFDRFKKILQADLVVLNGNGLMCDLFMANMWWLLIESYLAKKLGKKVVAINQTIDVDSPIMRNLVKNVYSHLDFIAVRERYSIKQLGELGVKEPQPVLAPDCAFLVNPVDETRIQEICQTEEITGTEIGLILRGDTNNDPHFWAEIITEIRKKFHRDILFISTCIRQDRPLAEEIKKHTHIRCLQNNYSCHEMIGLYQRLSIIISERYHANVFGIIAGTPVLPLRGNTAKTHGLFKLFDYPLDVLEPIIQENRGVLMKNIEYLLANSEKIRDLLKKAFTELRRQAELNISPTLEFWKAD